MQSLWMIVANLLFACMGVCVKLGSAYFSAGELVFYRGFVGLLLMALLARWQGISYRTPHWRRQLSRGLSGTGSLMCYFFALGALPLATAVTLNYTSPLFVALLLALWFREPVGRSLFGAVALESVWWYCCSPRCNRTNGWAPSPGWARASSPAWPTSTSANSAASASPKHAPCSGSPCHQPAQAALGAGVRRTSRPELRGAAILGVGIFGGCAQLAMTRAYRYGKTVVAANLSYSTVIFSSLFGVALWGEALPSTS
jgi:drug/metabolite transporter (DMT)-like permease